MSPEISTTHIERWMLAFADQIMKKQDYLTELDAAIGDGDHGLNMRRGVERLRERMADIERLRERMADVERLRERMADDKVAPSEAALESDLGQETDNIGILLRTIAMTIISGVGGAAGALYGSFFLNAAKEAKMLLNNDPNQGRSASASQFAQILRSGLDGLKQRGKAEMGEKTMIDAFEPAIDALQASIKQGKSTSSAFLDACQAAENGMFKTIEMLALKGRASYLGPRSIGHQDPGATSTFYLIEAAHKVFADEAFAQEDK